MPVEGGVRGGGVRIKRPLHYTSPNCSEPLINGAINLTDFIILIEFYWLSSNKCSHTLLSSLHIQQFWIILDYQRTLALVRWIDLVKFYNVLELLNGYFIFIWSNKYDY